MIFDLSSEKSVPRLVFSLDTLQSAVIFATVFAKSGTARNLRISTAPQCNFGMLFGIYAKRGKNASKKVKKVLDSMHKLCYNIKC